MVVLCVDDAEDVEVDTVDAALTVLAVSSANVNKGVVTSGITDEDEGSSSSSFASAMLHFNTSLTAHE